MLVELDAGLRWQKGGLDKTRGKRSSTESPESSVLDDLVRDDVGLLEDGRRNHERIANEKVKRISGIISVLAQGISGIDNLPPLSVGTVPETVTGNVLFANDTPDLFVEACGLETGQE